MTPRRHRWRLSAGALALCALACATQPPREPIPPHALGDWAIVPGQRIGPVARMTSREELVDRLGAENVVDASIPLAEGFCSPGTRVFPGTPDELEILWYDDERVEVSEVRVRGAGSRWSTAAGVRIGITLAELEAKRGGVVELSGFGWDGGGSATWEEDGGSVALRLAPDARSSELLRRSPHAGEVQGDRLMRSDHPVLRALTIVVADIALRWDPTILAEFCG